MYTSKRYTVYSIQVYILKKSIRTTLVKTKTAHQTKKKTRGRFDNFRDTSQKTLFINIFIIITLK